MPESRSIDIDYKEEFLLAKKLLKKMQSKHLEKRYYKG